MNKTTFCMELFYFAIFTISIPFLILFSIFVKIRKCVCSPKQNKKIAGEIAVVTGAGQGLGHKIAIELAKRGCDIAVVDIQEKLALETANHISQTYGVKAKAYKVDVSNYQQLMELREKVSSELGDTTILVNNAAILLLPLQPKPEAIQRMINVNFTSVCLVNAIFLPQMKKMNRGRILTISSISALFTSPYCHIYGATKSALRSLTTALRIELMMENKNITSTTVFPWFITTNKLVQKVLSFTFVPQVRPFLDGDFVAQRSVSGMLRGEQEIVIPSSTHYIYKILELLPTDVRDMLNTIIERVFSNNCFKQPEVLEIFESSVDTF